MAGKAVFDARVVDLHANCRGKHGWLLDVEQHTIQVSKKLCDGGRPKQPHAGCTLESCHECSCGHAMSRDVGHKASQPSLSPNCVDEVPADFIGRKRRPHNLETCGLTIHARN